MNKICILLLTAYISFMACGVKKQIVRSKSLSDSLLNQESTSIQALRKHLTVSDHRNDSLLISSVQRGLTIDGVDWVISDTPYPRLLRIKGIHFNTTENIQKESRHDSVKLLEDTTVHKQATKQLKTHVRKQKQAVSRQTVRSAALWKIILFLVILLAATILYLFRKKIFPLRI